MVYAFFKFTWAVRQFGFVSILLGMAPSVSRPTVSEEERERFSLNAAKILDQAGHEYNYGLRAYYFALAYLCWFVNVHCGLLMVAATRCDTVCYTERE